MSKLALVAAFALVASLASASGAAAREPASARVFYGDLDLSTAKGARLMLKRIHRTVEQLCAPSLSPVIIPPQRRADNARCKAEAMQRAVASLNTPMVTAEYDRAQPQPSLVAAAN